MDITVYLPDEVAQRAKAQNVNLSRVLRDTLTAQFAEEDAVSATLVKATTVTLELKTEEGRDYRGRMEATLIGKDVVRGTDVYLRQSGEVITYRSEDRRFLTVADPANELLAVLPTGDYIAAMDALGILPEVDLDAGFVAVAPAIGVVPPTGQRAGRQASFCSGRPGGTSRDLPQAPDRPRRRTEGGCPGRGGAAAGPSCARGPA